MINGNSRDYAYRFRLVIGYIHTYSLIFPNGGLVLAQNQYHSAFWFTWVKCCTWLSSPQCNVVYLVLHLLCILSDVEKEWFSTLYSLSANLMASSVYCSWRQWLSEVCQCMIWIWRKKCVKDVKKVILGIISELENHLTVLYELHWENVLKYSLFINFYN